jgi:hypothetical protein
MLADFAGGVNPGVRERRLNHQDTKDTKNAESNLGREGTWILISHRDAEAPRTTLSSSP